MLKSLNEIPTPARWLGFGGLLPFGAAAVGGLMISDPVLHELSLRALLAYGAVILSFLGGVRWGLAIVPTASASLATSLAISVLPPLLGWAALLLPPAGGLFALAIGFAGMLILDTQLPQAPCWYRRLRMPLSLGALGALVLGLAV